MSITVAALELIPETSAAEQLVADAYARSKTQIIHVSMTTNRRNPGREPDVVRICTLFARPS